MLTVKLLINSVVSTPGTLFFTVDIKTFYLMNPLERYWYIRLKLSDIPDDVIEFYNLHSKVDKRGYEDTEIRRGMYGLPESGILAQKLFKRRLSTKGYY